MIDVFIGIGAGRTDAEPEMPPMKGHVELKSLTNRAFAVLSVKTKQGRAEIVIDDQDAIRIARWLIQMADENLHP